MDHLECIEVYSREVTEKLSVISKDARKCEIVAQARANNIVLCKF
jgi:hypothetical protein